MQIESPGVQILKATIAGLAIVIAGVTAFYWIVRISAYIANQLIGINS